MRHKSAVQFFFSHGGYSYDPKSETKIQARWRCARSLARAKAYARANDWTCEWSDDWDIGSHVRFYGEAYSEEPSTCESCLLRDADGNVLASLGCIDDADANYRRVIEAELASEALSAIDQSLQREATSAGDVPDVREVIR